MYANVVLIKFKKCIYHGKIKFNIIHQKYNVMDPQNMLILFLDSIVLVVLFFIRDKIRIGVLITTR